MRKKIDERLEGSPFEMEIYNMYLVIFRKNFDDWKKSGFKKHFENFVSKEESKIIEIFKRYATLNEVLSDLDKTLIFLKTDKRQEIISIFPGIESQEEYYKYHLENFIIRVITITDIMGKLGNLIFETSILEEKCNGYSFKEKIKSIDVACSLKMEQLLTETKKIKQIRHDKLHKGESEINYFEGVLYLGEMSEKFNMEKDPIIEEFTDGRIKEAIEKMEEEIDSLLTIVAEILNFFLPKLVGIKNRN